jgi:hypothetical protein
MEPTVYVETSIVSYLAARPSRDVITAAHQQLTTQWWATRRSAFRLHISELVVQEASDGDPDAVRRRLDLLEGIPAVAVTADAVSFARSLVENRVVPRTAEADALHIAIAAAGGMEYLLTWNCRHIANAQIRGKIEELARLRGFEPPILCTPEELMETDQ